MNFFQLEDVDTLPPTWTEGKVGFRFYTRRGVYGESIFHMR